MSPEFYSLEFIIRMHVEARKAYVPIGVYFRIYCDRGFLDALANEENQ